MLRSFETLVGTCDEHIEAGFGVLAGLYCAFLMVWCSAGNVSGTMGADGLLVLE
jgi:hypothetical protein